MWGIIDASLIWVNLVSPGFCVQLNTGIVKFKARLYLIGYIYKLQGIILLSTFVKTFIIVSQIK